MIRNMLLVAAREYRQIARNRSFWITLMLLPLLLGAMPLITRMIAPPGAQTLMLIDQSASHAGTAISDRLTRDHQRDVLIALAAYTRRHDLRDLAPDAVWAKDSNWYSDVDVARFTAEGGEKAALATLARRPLAQKDSFKAPEPDFRLIPAPASIVATPLAQMDKALASYLTPADKSGRKPTDYVLVIPPDFGAQPMVKLWTNGQPRGDLMALLQSTLTNSLRAHLLETNGVAPPIAMAANVIAPAIAVTQPPAGAGRERVLVRSILPLACAYILLMSLLSSGSWMLQSTIEERGGKLIEAVLACVTPNEFMYGKLIGTVAIGFTMILTWMVCGFIAAFATQGAIAQIIRPALEPLSSIGSVATILYFFLAGYIMLSLIFLVIGAMSDAMQDAQGFLAPTIMIIMLPFILLAQVILRGSDSIALQVMTWIPIWTPFTVLARLGSGIAPLEIVGAGAVLLAFIILEIIFLGRVFRASLLGSGGRPNLRKAIWLMRAR